MSEQKKFTPNKSNILTSYDNLEKSLGGRWIEDDTAILIIHGIGNQNPLETLDGFSRGLIETFQKSKYNLLLEHHLAKKSASDSQTPWFDNFLRIRQENGEGANLDIYEYFWAHETEGQASIKDLNNWLNNVTQGAKKFYENNVDFAQNNEDRSIFVKNGKFRPFPYWLCVNLIPQLFVFINWLIDILVNALKAIPVIGPIVSFFIRGKMDGKFDKISNILNDVSIYNTTDAKSKFFKYAIVF